MKKVLAVLVNYGDEQLTYLQQVVNALKQFEKYEVTVMVNSNIPLNITGVDAVQIFTLDNYQYLPLTCRRTLWENREGYDLFIYGENDHLFLEHHLDKHLEYTQLLPKNRIAGLIQYEENAKGRFYPAYHRHYEWDFEHTETYGGKVFAYFDNVHQASFILTRDQLERIGKKMDFVELVKDKPYGLFQRVRDKLKKMLGLRVVIKRTYSLKCKVNTDIYQYAGMQKVICVSEFDENLIHHLPNLYIKGDKGRQMLSSSEDRMATAIERLLAKQTKSA